VAKLLYSLLKNRQKRRFWDEKWRNRQFLNIHLPGQASRKERQKAAAIRDAARGAESAVAGKDACQSMPGCIIAFSHRSDFRRVQRYAFQQDQFP